MKSIFHIGNRAIGGDRPVYVVAELSANHNGSLDRAKAIVRAAKDAGADAVKLQTYTADTLTLNCGNECFRIRGGTVWDGRTLHDLYAEASMPWKWHAELMALANSLGLDCFSTPFDATAVRFLESLNVPAYKIASLEIVDIPLLRTVARTRKPIVLSTGAAALAEIEEAVQTVREAGCEQLALLHCVSAYPAPPNQMNLRTIADMARRFGVVGGLSDHTLGAEAAIAAVALGARIVEKHLTLARADGGPDAAFSSEPHEFRAMVDGIRVAQSAVGDVRYEPAVSEDAVRAYRRSLFVCEDMKSGDAFTSSNVRSLRPGNGLHPRHYDAILGKHASMDICKGTPLSWELIQNEGGE